MPIDWEVESEQDLAQPQVRVDIPQIAPGQPGRAQLAYQNNNPGNLRNVDGSWRKFERPEDGYQAIKDRAARHADESLSDYLTRYAPPSENDTESYIKNAEKSLGVPRSTKISKIDADKLAQFHSKQESGTSIWQVDEEKPITPASWEVAEEKPIAEEPLFNSPSTSTLFDPKTGKEVTTPDYSGIPGLAPGLDLPGVPKPPLPAPNRVGTPNLEGNAPNSAESAPESTLHKVFMYPERGVEQAIAGAERMAEPLSTLAPAQVGPSVINPKQPPVSPAEQARLSKQFASGAADVLGGATQAATPFMMGGMIAAPVEAALSIGIGALTQKGAEELLKKLDVPEEYAALASTIAGLAGAGASGYLTGLPGMVRNAAFRARLRSILQDKVNAEYAARVKTEKMAQEAATPKLTDKGEVGPVAEPPKTAKVSDIVEGEFEDLPETKAAEPETKAPANEAVPVEPETAVVKAGQSFENPDGKKFTVTELTADGKVRFESEEPTGVVTRGTLSAGLFKKMVSGSKPVQPGQPKPEGEAAPAPRGEEVVQPEPSEQVATAAGAPEETHVPINSGDQGLQQPGEVRPGEGSAPGVQPVPPGNGPGGASGLPEPGAGASGVGQPELPAGDQGANTGAVRRVTGSAPIPLSPEGVAQDQALAAKAVKMPFDFVISSPETRALQTAGFFGKPTQWQQFNARRAGALEGQVSSEVKPQLADLVKNPDTVAPGNSPLSGEPGESYRDFITPNLQATRVLEKSLKPGERALVVTHGGNLQAINAWAEAGKPADYKFDLAPLADKPYWSETGQLFRMGPRSLERVADNHEPGLYFLEHSATAFNPPKASQKDTAAQPAERSIADILGSATRKYKIGGQQMEDADPRAQIILKALTPESQKQINALMADAKNPKLLGAGFDHVVIDLGNGKVMRLGPLPKHEGTSKFLPNPQVSREIGGVGVEVYPKFSTQGITADDVDAVKDELRKHGLKWDDGSVDNLARDSNGNLKIIDGQLLKRGEKGAPAQPAEATPTEQPKAEVEPRQKKLTRDDLNSISFDEMPATDETEGVAKNRGVRYREAKFEAENNGIEEKFKVKVGSNGSRKIESLGKTREQHRREAQAGFDALKPETKAAIEATGFDLPSPTQKTIIGNAMEGRPQMLSLKATIGNIGVRDRFMELFPGVNTVDGAVKALKQFAAEHASSGGEKGEVVQPGRAPELSPTTEVLDRFHNPETGMQGEVAKISRGYSAILRDVDSGNSTGQAFIYPTRERAIAKAKQLAGIKESVQPGQGESAAQTQASPPKDVEVFGGAAHSAPITEQPVAKVGDRVAVDRPDGSKANGTVTGKTKEGMFKVAIDNGVEREVHPTRIHPLEKPVENTTIEAANEPTEAPARGRKGALEGNAPEDVQGAPTERPPGQRGTERSEADAGSLRTPDREGDGPGPGEGSDQGDVGIPAGGERHPGSRREPSERRGAVSDYRITPADHIGEGTTKQKASDNIDSIRALKAIESEGREATPAEQKTLAKYVGWGGMPQAFMPEWQVPREWAGVRADLDGLLTPDEFESARASTPNAHFTSPLVVQGMWDAAKRLGLMPEGGQVSVLEPAMGTGNFFGLMPEGTEAQRVGVELDSITGRIAKLLYPNADVHVSGFETVRLPGDYFDLAIGNVPFGNYAIHDPAYKRVPGVTRSIHDYFFAKAMDKVRPGGVIAFITSSYTMDKQDPFMREYLAERANLLGAIRLPNTAFKGNAGTEVTTDIIFLQKRGPNTPASGEAWTDLAPHTGEQELADGSNGPAQMEINEYYARHPEMMIGKMGLYGSMYAAKSAALVGELTPENLAEAVSHLPENVVTEWQAPADAFDSISAVPAAGEVKDGAYTIKDGQLLVRRGDQLRPVEMSAEQAARVRGMVTIRNAMHEIFRTQREGVPDNDIKQAINKLNVAYDGYTKANGALHTKENAKAFYDDPDAPVILALENWDPETKKATKSDMFSKRVIDTIKPAESADNARDALGLSLNEKGRIDWTRMQELTGKTPEEMQAELGPLIFQNPAGKAWEPADEYLSGNVRKKLAEATAAARTDRSFDKNVEALKAVQPKDLIPGEIKARLGSSWIDKADVHKFIAELLDMNPNTIALGHSEQLATWTLQVKNKDTVANKRTWGTSRMDGHELISDALNMRSPTVYDWVGSGADRKMVVNEPETLAARGMQQSIKDRFSNWAWEDPERAKRLTEAYNQEHNAERLWQPDGSHLTFPGMNVGLKLRPHQKNGVWRIVRGDGNVLLAHVVGSGKTLEIVAAAMEMRRLGRARKPLINVPKNRVKGTASEWLRAYPSANLLVIGGDDFEPAKRQEMMSRIATGNWDGVIISYENFTKIPVSDETFNDYVRSQIKELTDYIIDAKGDKSNAKIVKELEKSKKRLEAKIRNTQEGIRRDRAITFEDLGVDALFVDEADSFKNLQFPTKMARVSGIPNTESDRAFDMYIKTQHIAKRNGGRGIVFATGTPIANSMAEVWTMQRYLQPKYLKEHGLQHFDAWAQTFGEVNPALEMKPDGSGVRVTNKFNKFINAPELMKGFRQMADVQTAKMLQLPVPKLKTGKPIIVSAKASPAQMEHLKSLALRAERVKGKKPTKGADNILVIGTDGQKASLDMRLIDPSLADHPGSKVNMAVDNIFGIWKETAKDRSTQLVFSDLGVPNKKNRGGFNVYNDVRQKLISRGVPAKEIAFIQDYAKNDDAKEELFAAINKGRVRILMGSTGAMGVGVNVQNKLIAEHHLDAPYRPRDVEQREGRMIRQGNENPDVYNYRYVTEPSLDARKWDILQNKAGFIDPFMEGNMSLREIEDISDAEIGYGEIAAIASGNPAIREKVVVDTDIRKLDAMRSRHQQQQYMAQHDVQAIPKEIEAEKSTLAKAEKDIKTRDSNEPTFTIGKKEFTGEGARKQAAAALANLLTKRQSDIAYPPGEWDKFPIGKYRGFELTGKDWSNTKGERQHADIVIHGNLSYALQNYHDVTDPEGRATSWIQGIEGKLRSIESIVAASSKNIDHLQKKLADTKQMVGAKFDKEDELKNLIERQKELEKILQTTPAAAATDAIGGEEGEEDEEAGGEDSASAGSAAPAKSAKAEVSKYQPLSNRRTPMVKSAWGGNVAQAGDFLTDTHMAMPRSAVQDPKKLEALSAAHKSGQHFSQDTLREFWNKAIDAATKPLTEIGWANGKNKDALNQMFYTDQGGSQLYSVDPDFAKTVESVTGASEVRGGKSDSTPLVYFKDGEPVAIIAPQRVGLEKPSEKEIKAALDAKSSGDEEESAAVQPGQNRFQKMTDERLATLAEHGKEELRPQARAEIARRKNKGERGSVPGDLLTLGAGKFVKEDIRPKLIAAAKIMAESRGDVLKILAPAAREGAQGTALTIRERAADLARATDRAEAALESARKFFDSQSFDENLDFIDRIETGQGQPDGRLQGIADTMREILDDRRKQVQDLGTGKLETFYEDYYPHIWKKPEAAEKAFKEWFSKRPMEGAKSFLKQRKIPTVRDGVDMGLEPESTNPVDMVVMKTREMDKYIFAHRAMDDLKHTGVLKFKRATEPMPAGYEKINDRIATVYEGKTAEGSLAIRGEYVAPEPAATIINNYLSPGLRKYASFRAYIGLANVLNQFQLGWSAYHLGFTSFDAAVSRTALGIMQAARGEPIKGLATALSSPVAPFRGMMLGDKILKEWYKPGTQGNQIAEVVDAMVMAGGRARMDRFYQTQITKNMMKALRSGNLLGAALRAPFALTEQAARPIMEWAVPRQKMAVFADLAQLEMERFKGKEDSEEFRAALAKAWDSVDNRMGQLVYDNLFWNKAVKDLSMASVRSVGWNLGTIREILGGGSDTAKFMADVVRMAKDGKSGQYNKRPEFTTRMAYNFALPIVAGIIGGIMYYLATHEVPEKLKDWYFPRRGPRGTAGWEKRMSQPSYVKDVVHWAHDPYGTVKGKIHPLLSTIAEMLSNKDYFDKPIRNPEDPLVKQMEDEAKHIGETFVPMAMRPMLAPDKKNQETTAEKVLPFIGITEAPKYIKEGEQPKNVRGGHPRGVRRSR